MKIIGGGLAGLSAAAALGSLGWRVDLHEAKPFLGGRATSFPLQPSDPDSERIDNCQHVLLRCCTNLLDFYRRCGVEDKIQFYDKLYFVRPGGAVDVLERGRLPHPFHLAGSFLRMGFLSWSDKLSLLRILRRLEPRASASGFPSDRINFRDWLLSHHATENSYNRFWRPVIVSALNEEPERASAAAAAQVFREGLLADRSSYEMGVPAVPLGELYSAALEQRLGPDVNVHLRSTVNAIDPQNLEADFCIAAVPFERIDGLISGLDLRLEKFEHSPITGVHLWFDRPVTDLPHASLLDRTMQWMFAKSDRYIQCVVSASRELLPLSREEIVDLARRDLAEFFPAAGEAKLERSHVIKEVRATYSIVPGLEADRPPATTKYANVFLAGDWTETGWPATMEGAVRSGYGAAEAAAKAAGQSAKFLV